MIAHEVRLKNVMSLYEDFRRDELYRGVAERGSLGRFSSSIGVSPAYVSHIRNGVKKIGNALARRIEVSTGKDYGWLDTDHEANSSRRISKDERVFCDRYKAIHDMYPEDFQRVCIELLAKALLEAVANQTSLGA